MQVAKIRELRDERERAEPNLDNERSEQLLDWRRQQAGEDDVQNGVWMTPPQFLTGHVDTVRLLHAFAARDEMVVAATERC